MKLDRKSLFKIGAAIFLLYLCIRYWNAFANFVSSALSAAAPLFIGCAVAYAVNILMGLYEKCFFPRSKKKFIKKSRRVFCLIFAFLTLAAVIALVVILVVPELVSAVGVIVAKAPGVMDGALDVLEKWDILPDDILNTLESIDWKSRIEQIVSLVTSGIGNVAGVVITTVTTVLSGVVTAFISVIFSVYLLFNKEKLSSQLDRVMRRYMNGKVYDKTKHVTSVLNDSFRRYVIGQSVEAVILGALCTIGMLIFRFPYATMVGALTAFTALIPIAGAYIGAIVGAFMIFTVSPVKALLFLVFIIVLQQLENNLIYPKVVGTSLGISGLWVLAAVVVGGGLAGIPGMFLGVPLASAAYRLLKEDVARGPDRAEEQ